MVCCNKKKGLGKEEEKKKLVRLQNQFKQGVKAGGSNVPNFSFLSINSGL